MLFQLAVVALSSISAVSAAPYNLASDSPSKGWQHSVRSVPHSTNTSTVSSNSTQIPFKFPLSNGFPFNLTNDDIDFIEVQAHGTLPNGPLPSVISDAAAGVFSLIAFNELFEVAFFTSLITNITNDVPGYEVGSRAVRTIILDALIAVQAQEELHALGANGILNNAGRPVIAPCEYVFPTSDFDSAITLASTFTDVVLGTLQGALAALAAAGDTEFLPLIGSVIGQEGEQNGFYRNLGNRVPSALPFLTRSDAPFAFSALNQNFVVPGSCPSLDLIPLHVFGELLVDAAALTPASQTLSFSFAAPAAAAANLSLVYINQQNIPIVVPLPSASNSTSNPAASNVTLSSDAGVISFSAPFPYDEYLLNGLTIAVVVKGTGDFPTVDAVAKATVFGPALIEVY